MENLSRNLKSHMDWMVEKDKKNSEPIIIYVSNFTKEKCRFRAYKKEISEFSMTLE